MLYLDAPFMSGNVELPYSTLVTRFLNIDMLSEAKHLHPIDA